AQQYIGYDPLTQGAGFLNAKGAVELARYLASADSSGYPFAADWTKKGLWGNRLIQGGQLTANGNAWSSSPTWGASEAADGEDVAWGSSLSDTGQNVVWGLLCGGHDCHEMSWS